VDTADETNAIDMPDSYPIALARARRKSQVASVDRVGSDAEVRVQMCFNAPHIRQISCLPDKNGQNAGSAILT
jgi:hypothetical protein